MTKKRGRPKIGKDRIVFTISPEMKAHIEKRASEQDISISEYLRRLIAADMPDTPDK